jgi:two-component sensor histidine kinase
VYDLLHKIYKRKNDTEKALEAFEKYVDIKYGSENIVRNTQIATFEESYYNLSKEKERIEALSKMKHLENASLHSKTQRNFAIIISLFLMVLGLLLYKRYWDKIRTNKILVAKNSEIETQKSLMNKALEERETLLKEIHHRVKNNLQIISSLLNLQSKKITDENVLASITEGKNRVEAMSLIHQNLYQSDQLTSINMQDYFLQLLSHLSRSFGRPEYVISYHVNAEEIFFDIDTAIPVGLMVNELVSNAYKHAFNNKEKGEINVSVHRGNNSKYQLKVSDNGVGFSEEDILAEANSLGLRLVKSLSTKQLKGDFTMQNKSGTVVTITFEELKKAG